MKTPKKIVVIKYLKKRLIMNFFFKFFAALISHQMEQRQKLERRMLHTKNELQSMKCGVSNLTVLLEARTKFIQTGLVDVSNEKNH